MTAPVLLALVVAIVVGVLAQRSRLCMDGGIRDAIMFKDFRLISAFIAIIVAVLIGNLILNKFVLGFEGQPWPTVTACGTCWAWSWWAGAPCFWAAAPCAS